MTLPLLLLTAFATNPSVGVPVRDGCGVDDMVVAVAQLNEPVVVRQGIAGESQACYAVSVTRPGAEVRGYILGDALPAVEEFERRRALEGRIPTPEAPASVKIAAAKKIEDPGPLAGRQFKPWSGIDWHGRAVDIRPGEAKVTLVVFWKPSTRAGRSHVMDMQFLSNRFSERGVRAVGLMEGASVASAKADMDDLEVAFPQAVDRSALASEFAVDAAHGTTLVLDRSGKVVASSSDAKKIQSVLAQMLSSN